MADPELDVLVVGAGPVGLAAAAFLHRAGAAVRVLDRRDGPSTWSRGSALHPRTLEVLDALPDDGGTVAGRLVTLGRPMTETHFAALPALLTYEHLDTRYPFVLMVPQTSTERVLREHLAGSGVEVEWNRAVAGLSQYPDGVLVRCDGAPELRARYVVGADGAHGVVRGAAGVGFDGEPATLAGFVADARLDRPPDQMHHWDATLGSVGVLPLPDGVFRVFGQDAADTRLDPGTARLRRDEPLDADGLRALLVRLVGDDLGLGEVVRAVRFGDASGYAERLRAGRVLVAGDAAHVHYPAGGQGLNAGVQDAANLAWKLAAEIAGTAPERIVHGDRSYDAERRPVARRLVADARAQSALMHTFSADGLALRELVGGWLAADGDVADGIRDRLSGLGVAYLLAGEPEPCGRRVPDLPLDGGAGLHRTLRPDRFVLAGLGGRTPPDVDDRRVTVASSARDWHGAGAVLVRPDGHAAAVWAPDELADVAAVTAVTRGWSGSAVHGDPELPR